MSIRALQEDFVKFRESCIWLRNCYNTFNVLYAEADNADSLQRTALTFFTDLNTILQEYFFLQVRRITDAAETRGRANLTVARINAGLQEFSIITDSILALSNRLHHYRATTADIANRAVAHNDHATAFQEGLVGAHGEGELENFMEAVQAYTDEVGIALNLGPLDYRMQGCAGDVRDLVRALQRASNPTPLRG